MTLSATEPDHRIGVTAVTGFLGSGKTRFVNQLLQQPEFANTVVIVNEIGQLGIDQANWSFVQPSLILLEGGCLCCQMQGSMNVTLQRLFTDALARRIPRFSHVLVETSGLADPSSLRFTLHNDFFLKARYAFNGSICMVDTVNAAEQMRYIEWSRQIVQADLVLLSRTDLASPDQIRACTDNLKSLVDVSVMSVPDFLLDGTSLLAPGGLALSQVRKSGVASAPFFTSKMAATEGSGSTESTGVTHKEATEEKDGAGQTDVNQKSYGPMGMDDVGEALPFDDSRHENQSQNEGATEPVARSTLRPVQRHSPIRVITIDLPEPLSRQRFTRELERIQEQLGTAMLRAKALVRFTAKDGLYLYNIVHSQQYPAQRLRDMAGRDIRTGLVLFLAGLSEGVSVPDSADFYRVD